MGEEVELTEPLVPVGEDYDGQVKPLWELSPAPLLLEQLVGQLKPSPVAHDYWPGGESDEPTIIGGETPEPAPACDCGRPLAGPGERFCLACIWLWQRDRIFPG